MCITLDIIFLGSPPFSEFAIFWIGAKLHQINLYVPVNVWLNLIKVSNSDYKTVRDFITVNISKDGEMGRVCNMHETEDKFVLNSNRYIWSEETIWES